MDETKNVEEKWKEEFEKAKTALEIKYKNLLDVQLEELIRLKNHITKVETTYKNEIEKLRRENEDLKAKMNQSS